MLTVNVLCVGTLKEQYLRDAIAEYSKRISGYARLIIKETKNDRELIPLIKEKKGYKIALCVEGKQMSSEELAAQLDTAIAESGSICLVIGSSHGLAPEVKAACRLRLSVSKLTFPHQMMRVLLLEVLYRSFSILKGSKYHK
jgi:23S rRNA (pseudouridine1915-N3)-methyltransferase